MSLDNVVMNHANEAAPAIFTYTLKRPLSSSPSLLLGVIGSLSFICLLIASVWAYLGARWVLAFACIDVLALAAAVVWCIRHAMDFERVTVNADTLHIERQLAGEMEQWTMARFYVRVKPQLVSLGPFQSPRLLIEAQQQSVVLGGFCHVNALKQLEMGLKRALRHGS